MSDSCFLLGLFLITPTWRWFCDRWLRNVSIQRRIGDSSWRLTRAAVGLKLSSDMTSAVTETFVWLKTPTAIFKALYSDVRDDRAWEQERLFWYLTQSSLWMRKLYWTSEQLTTCRFTADSRCSLYFLYLSLVKQVNMSGQLLYIIYRMLLFILIGFIISFYSIVLLLATNFFPLYCCVSCDFSQAGSIKEHLSYLVIVEPWLDKQQPLQMLYM